MASGYAVLDFETTGLAPGYGHRVLEVGVVLLSSDLEIEGGLDSLVNPKRDVGPTRIHGVTARDVFDAPAFEDVVPALLEALVGRVVVGHNVAFDLRFLGAELDRCGYRLPDVVAIDTMQLGRRLATGGVVTSLKLYELAACLGVATDELLASLGPQCAEHSAYADALVTSALLRTLYRLSESSEAWKHHLASAARVAWPQWHRPAQVPGKRRGPRVGAGAVSPGWGSHRSLSVGAVLRAMGNSGSPAAMTGEYATLLDAALADRVLDTAEVDALIESARRLGLDAATLGSLHRGHFDGIVREAWSDGVLTADEAADIVSLAQLLGIDDDSVRVALGEHHRESQGVAGQRGVVPELVPGSIIVLTGEMSVGRSQLEAEIEARGYVVGPRVTKKATLVVAADPYTQSGKAQKARDYGIAVVGEADGIALLRG